MHPARDAAGQGEREQEADELQEGVGGEIEGTEEIGLSGVGELVREQGASEGRGELSVPDQDGVPQGDASQPARHARAEIDAGSAEAGVDEDGAPPIAPDEEGRRVSDEVGGQAEEIGESPPTRPRGEPDPGAEREGRGARRLVENVRHGSKLAEGRLDTLRHFLGDFGVVGRFFHRTATENDARMTKHFDTTLPHRSLPSIDAGSTVHDAMAYVRTFDAPAVIVVDGGQPLGVFTGDDMMARAQAAGLDPARTPLRDLLPPVEEEAPVKPKIRHVGPALAKVAPANRNDPRIEDPEWTTTGWVEA